MSRCSCCPRSDRYPYSADESYRHRILIRLNRQLCSIATRTPDQCTDESALNVRFTSTHIVRVYVLDCVASPPVVVSVSTAGLTD